MCASPAIDFKYDTLYYHSVVITNLQPTELYWYCPHLDKHCHQLLSPRPPGNSGDFAFIMYGDMGESDHHRAKSPGCVHSASLSVACCST